MEWNWPTVIVLAVIAVIVAAIIVGWVINKKKGKTSCSCGGSCGACGMNCSGRKS